MFCKTLKNKSSTSHWMRWSVIDLSVNAKLYFSCRLFWIRSSSLFIFQDKWLISQKSQETFSFLVFTTLNNMILLWPWAALLHKFSVLHNQYSYKIKRLYSSKLDPYILTQPCTFTEIYKSFTSITCPNLSLRTCINSTYVWFTLVVSHCFSIGNRY